MRNPIRVGDQLENGGEVTTASSEMTFLDKLLACQGDEALCTLHGKTTIAEGNPSFPGKGGKPIAMHYHLCACGCRLLSSLQNVNIA
ncbi:PAAR domain-containing protein [Paraburkholderia domus]|uniref:PAAR domain-containing protein n=1 Tax=Paraburkholderia domus TaxID=2793075 RepID=UPI001912ED5E|nr:PAAR domain-containing protein [Paraburkholderia domus]MBK5118326.1 PAAR domain-containing protein [Burkholderia sp. R-69980]MBK5179799.1 PAAR domain-containing protein [Burkholderia sp. R-69749]MCI0144413.1 PAAR domain-containing protein [Paraburkholderia sediminicola]CAE6770306.1 hypothetical protein R69749_01203 [Paraburkholderia domus]